MGSDQTHLTGHGCQFSQLGEISDKGNLLPELIFKSCLTTTLRGHATSNSAIISLSMKMFYCGHHSVEEESLPL